ncbi:MAG: hypothetical protein EPO01_16220 [Aquabacterium sp.]|nr:MAG: hypothetical protein EPO01_16220 [Aquabacterium sp.]
MKLDPFRSVDGVPFSASREDVVRLHGRPLSQERNAVRLTALDYGGVVYRFQDAEDGGRLEEITCRAPVLDLGHLQVAFADLAAFVRGHDARAFERAGFLVSPRLGLAFVPGEPSWVTALAAHCLPQWEAMSGVGLH